MDESVTRLFDLSGRVAIVTGGTKGIGRAIAEGLAAAGASVVVASRDQGRCDAAAAEIARDTGGSLLGVACHMGDWDAIPALVERTRAHFGHIDIVVNNAGIHPVHMSVVDMTSEYLDKLFAVNLKGPVRLAGLVAPIMGERGGGSIVNVSSIEAYGGAADIGAYSSLKAALINFTRVMAKEWAPLGVRVNALCPGPFDSEMMRGTTEADPELPARLAESTLLKRVADCREIVGAAVYLASDASSYVTGEDHVVAGGLLRA